MHKISYQCVDDWFDFVHPKIFARGSISPEAFRLRAGFPKDDPAILHRLLDSMPEPFLLLYVLHTPRGEGAPGDIKAIPYRLKKSKNLLSTYWEYLSRDARFDLWFYSPAINATLVWDRHDLLFAYGPLDNFEAILSEWGCQHGYPVLPSPHTHNYHAGFDISATQLLERYPWKRSPLHQMDDQGEP